MLLNNEKDKIVIDIYHTKGIVSLPVLQIVKIEDNNKRILFTVETVFQESKPGNPEVKEIDGNIYIADNPESYVFNLTNMSFDKNEKKQVVYLGHYRDRDQRFKETQK